MNRKISYPCFSYVHNFFLILNLKKKKMTIFFSENFDVLEKKKNTHTQKQQQKSTNQNK